jgi:hypothetical protein
MQSDMYLQQILGFRVGDRGLRVWVWELADARDGGDRRRDRGKAWAVIDRRRGRFEEAGW